MRVLAFLALAGAMSGATSSSVPAGAGESAILRRVVAETALAQVDALDPAWQPEQRDCAGLVRFAYRSAFKRLRPARLKTPLWGGSDFADAETLLQESFVPLGRGAAARARIESGDLLAFRQGSEDEPVFHLMLVVAPADPALPALVVYHPGAKGEAVRMGRLESLATDAPHEWRPVPENGAFLGFYRFAEW